jgi:uncharacterized protein (TIGR00255 family)
MQPVRDGLPPEAQSGVEQALEAALDELERMRTQEGATLATEMRGRLATIEQQSRIIEAAKERQLDDYRSRLQKRISDLLAREVSVELDQSRLAQEVAYLADRSDISEEITRLNSHLGQFSSTLDEGAEIGKRLDFLLQELNREANTILSKSTDLTVKDAALTIKAEIEKLREQVQNIE